MIYFIVGIALVVIYFLLDVRDDEKKRKQRDEWRYSGKSTNFPRSKD